MSMLGVPIGMISGLTGLPSRVRMRTPNRVAGTNGLNEVIGVINRMQPMVGHGTIDNPLRPFLIQRIKISSYIGLGWHYCKIYDEFMNSVDPAADPDYGDLDPNDGGIVIHPFYDPTLTVGNRGIARAPDNSHQLAIFTNYDDGAGLLVGVLLPSPDIFLCKVTQVSGGDGSASSQPTYGYDCFPWDDETIKYLTDVQPEMQRTIGSYVIGKIGLVAIKADGTRVLLWTDEVPTIATCSTSAVGTTGGIGGNGVGGFDDYTLAATRAQPGLLAAAGSGPLAKTPGAGPW